MNANTSATADTLYAVSAHVAPDLTDALYRKAEQLAAYYHRESACGDIIGHAVDATLRHIQREGFDLASPDPQKRQLARETGLAHLSRWAVGGRAANLRRRRVGESDQAGRDSEESLEGLAAACGDAAAPAADLHGVRAGASFASDPDSELTCGEVGLMTVSVLREMGIKPALAWAWTLHKQNEAAAQSKLVTPEQVLDWGEIAVRVARLTGVAVSTEALRQWKRRHFAALDARQEEIAAHIAARLVCHETGELSPSDL